MQERLEWVKRQPANWVHWAPVRGGLEAHRVLQKRYPKARCWLVEARQATLQVAQLSLAKPWWHPLRWLRKSEYVPSPPPGVADLLWSNMALHMVADPQALISQWHRGLAVDGFLMFSCLGPDTLRELRVVYQALGWLEPAHEFTDMHDWGDMLVQAGFGEPVMDMERITLTFETPQRLLQELRELGRNLHPRRFAGLRGRKWLEQLHEVLGRELVDPNANGRLALTFEVIYGHAFKPQPRLRVGPQTVVALEDMRLALQQGQVRNLHG